MAGLRQWFKGKRNVAAGRAKQGVGYKRGRPATELRGDVQVLKGKAQEGAGRLRRKA
jgi:uncharacterized protein YjbJ (UPF0337 family)